MGRERPTEALTHVFRELAACDDGIGASPAFAPRNLPDTVRRFLDLVVLPMMVRALFGEDLAALRAEIGPHAARTVAFFLAACGYREAPAPPMSAQAFTPSGHPLPTE